MGAWPGQWLVCLTEFLIFYEAVRSSDMYLKHTRKSPVGVEAPRWKPKARTCARVHPRLQLLTTMPSGGPGSTLPSPFWAHSSPKGPLGPEASQTDEMSRTAGQTRNSSPFKHWQFSQPSSAGESTSTQDHSSRQQGPPAGPDVSVPAPESSRGC